MRKYVLFFLLIFGCFFAQKQNNFSFELQGNTFSGMGDNFIADGLKPFTGYGLGLSGIFYKNFGLGLEFHQGFTEVKDISVFGDLSSQNLTSLEILALYRYKTTNKFELEGNMGVGSMKLHSRSAYRNKGFSEGGNAFIIGAKGLYAITKNNSLYLVGGPRLYFLSTFTKIDNHESDKYYSNATLLNFSLGLRIYF